MVLVSTGRSAKQQRERVLSEVLLRGDPAGWLGWDPQSFEAEGVLSAWREALRPRTGRSPQTLQLYTHFAFCRMSCKFCQYWHVLTRDDAELEAYTDHLVALVKRYKDALGRVRVSNAYFGGGTPTALTAGMLRRFLKAFRETFDVAHEFTTEAHPSTLDEAKMDVLADGGINRISMGLQSLDEAVLQHVGRSNGGTPAVRRVIERSHERGMMVNVDLIVGLPGQTPESFQRDVGETLDLGPDTVTLYRYQPVHRLPEAAPPEMAFRKVLRPLWGSCAAKGYFPLGSVADSRYSVLLVRASARVAGYVGSNIVSALGTATGAWEARRYTDVDRDDVHMMGLGPGAVSHIVGHGWFRDVTAVRDATGQASPRYWGTRMSEEDELGSHTLLGLAGGDWAEVGSLRTKAAGAKIASVIAAGVETGVLQQALRWVRVRPGVPEAERVAFLEQLLPERVVDAGSAARALAFKLRKDVQPELVDIDRAHRDLSG